MGDINIETKHSQVKILMSKIQKTNVLKEKIKTESDINMEKYGI